MIDSLENFLSHMHETGGYFVSCPDFGSSPGHYRVAFFDANDERVETLSCTHAVVLRIASSSGRVRNWKMRQKRKRAYLRKLNKRGRKPS